MPSSASSDAGAEGFVGSEKEGDLLLAIFTVAGLVLIGGAVRWGLQRR
jgi:hypothetical protein